MSKNLSDVPFTEGVERVAQLSRLDPNTNDLSRVRAAYNDQYVRELPAKEDWTFLIASSALACIGEYKVGSVSVNTQDTAVTFSSDVALDATFTGRQIKFNSNPNVYTLTYSNATGATISPPLSGATNVSGDAYSIFQAVYALAPDFDRFPKEGGLQLFQGGKMTILPENPIQTYYKEYNPFPTSTPKECRITSPGTDGVPRVELMPPPRDAIVIPYEYIRRLRPLRETTAGYVDVNSSGTAVTGSAGTTRFTEGSTGNYFRIDAFGEGDDSEWYRVSAVTHNSSLTIAVAFGLSGAATATYTISPIPEYPLVLQPALVYGAVQAILADQNDPLYAVMGSLKTASLVEARKLYKSRRYNQDIETVFEDFLYRR